MILRRFKKTSLKSLQNTSGFSLVETLIAVLLISVVVTSVFSLALTSKTMAIKSNRRAAALLYSRQVIEKIKAYVTGDSSTDAALAAGAPADWHIPQDLCNSGEANCSKANCYALEECKHDLTPMLPVDCGPDVGFCSGSPVNGKLTYTVSNVGVCTQGCAKKVQFSITWDE